MLEHVLKPQSAYTLPEHVSGLAEEPPLDTILKQTCTGLLSELGVRRVLNGSGTWTKFGS